MIDPTVLSRVRELCEDSLRVPSQTSSVAYVDLLGDANIQLDARHVVALLDENAALRAERDEMKGALAAYGIGKEGEDWYYTCEPDGQVDAADLTDAIGKMSALKDEDQLALESRLAALTAAGEKVVEWGEQCHPVDGDSTPLDALKLLLRSDP